MIRHQLPDRAVGRVCQSVCWFIFAYWASYAVVAPVTNIDAQIYNVARLPLAMRGGLFGNVFFTSPYHLMWPWTFDAVHLPFVQIGWGFALPSFSCLVGTCLVVFYMIKEKFGSDAGWVAVTGLLGLTCLVYQGTSTKNDIPILFSGAVWAYGLWRWRRERKVTHIFWMILAIGFMAGAKTTGALYGGLLALWTLWELRGNRMHLLNSVFGLIGAVFLFGSVETYLESAFVWGHPLGPPGIVDQLRNSDGFRGWAANLSRYIVGSVYLGPSHFRSGPPAIVGLGNAEREFLAWTGLNNAGVDPFLKTKDLFFVQSGFEELSGFGPIGTLAMATMLFACVCWRTRETWWRLAIAGFLGITLVSYNLAFSDWGNRFMICWYALGTVALVCFLWSRETALRRLFRWLFALLAVASAIAAPLLSFNRKPASIVASLVDRDRFETCMEPLIGEVRSRLRIIHSAKPNSRVFFVVRKDSAVLPILEDKGLNAILVTPARFLSLLEARQVAEGDLVIEDTPVKTAQLEKIEEVSAPNVFSENGSWNQTIYKFTAFGAKRQ